MRRFAKLTLLPLALWAFIFAPVSVAYAETTTADSGTYNFSNGAYTTSNDTQFAKYADSRVSSSQYSIGQGLGQAGGQCVFGSMLSEMLQSFIKYLMEQHLETVGLDTAEGTTKVPVMLNGSTRRDIQNERAKEVCALALWGYCILPSLDAIAFCFINEVIHYISQATIEWIKSGFDGSPAFVDNPEKFFSNAADSIAGGLLNEITDGLLCEPFRANIQVKLLNEHVGQYKNRAKGCKLSEVGDRWEDWANGDFVNFSTSYAGTQNAYNNELGSFLESEYELNRRLFNADESLKVQLGWSDGFLHVKDPETGKISTPGRVLESQLNRRLGLAENRLLVADEFDEIINTLVNELVKLALSELLNGDDDKSDSEDSGSLTSVDESDSGDSDSDGDSSDSGSTDSGSSDSGTADSGSTDSGSSGSGSTGGTDPDGGSDGIGSDLAVTCKFDDDHVLEGDTATATAVVSGSVGTVTYKWSQDFGGTGTTTTKSFVNEGTYYAQVKVTDQDWDGQTKDATCDLKVSEDFEVKCAVDHTRIQPGDRVLYTATVTGNDGDVVDYDWGGAAGGTGQSISKRYGTAGTYSVHVEAVDEEGNRESVACPAVTAAR